MTDQIIVVGGGPSGLAAAYECVQHGAPVTVFERLDQVGGLCRTIAFKHSRFDIGPHRFFTKNPEVSDLFQRVLGEDLVTVRRKTRILYDDNYFDYPLTPLNAMTGIGLRSGLAIAGSYAVARIRSIAVSKPAETFEDWIIERFGRELYETFFKNYTEKVWGIPCHRIGADWASQRIRGLSLGAAIRNAVFKSGRSRIKTLIDEFSYPRLGAGQFYEKLGELIMAGGGRVRTGYAVRSLKREGPRMRSVVIEDRYGGTLEVEGRYFLTSATLTDVVGMIDPPPPEDVLHACRSLRYRDHIGVNLLVRGAIFPDNWIYVHSQDVALARVTSYQNFSRDMAANSDVSPITVEYFAFPKDDLSSLDDSSLIELAMDELRRLRLLTRDQLLDGFVVRSEKAYPVMEIGYQGHVATIKAWLDRLENLLPIGRAGMFKYNNQDHAVATGLLSARRALGLGRYDPWLINIDAAYHEGNRGPG